MAADDGTPRTAGEDVRAAADAAAEAARNVGEEARAAGTEFVREAKHTARETAERGREGLADHLEHISEVMDGSADELRDSDTWLASAMEAAARGIRSTAHHLHEQNLSGLANEASDYARKRPEIFLGGAFVLGLALGRIVRSADGGPGHAPAHGARTEESAA